MKTKEWHNRQFKDQYVKKASKFGFVSRSAFKLIEIEKKFNLIRSSNFILELGSSPGGWTQVIESYKINNTYKLICVDKDEPKIYLGNNIFFIKNDFQNNFTIINKIKKIHKNGFDLILSDMAPNTIGHSKTDHLRIIQMAEDIYQFSIDFLKKGSSLVIKILQGSNEKEIILLLKKKFRSVSYFKPKSSRATSREIYLISSGYDLL